jgi:23S rRNA (uracil1939-C5)-methyltransferase
VNIERIVPGGHGLAFNEGIATFVALSVPGDRILVHKVLDKRQYLQAQSMEIVEESAQRVAPPCPYFGQCGGCDFQHMTYECQLQSKCEMLLDALRRVGKIRISVSDISTVASPPFAYRNRLQLKVSNKTNFSWGFFATGSHHICQIQQCLLASEELWKFLSDLRQLIEASPRVLNSLAEVEVFQGGQGQYLVEFHLGSVASSLEQLREDLQRSVQNWQAHSVSLFLSAPSGATLKVWGDGHVWKVVGGLQFRVSNRSFFQINDFLLNQLLTSAVEGFSGRRALDLCCGVGFFSLRLAKSFQEVWAMEKNSVAVEDLRANILRNNLTNIRVFNQDFGPFVRSAEPLLKDLDLMLLDPPRTGVDKGNVVHLAKLGVPDVVYVSCDPAMLARDLRIFCDHHYELSSVCLLDLFPQTHHLETVVRLRKKVDQV